MRAIAIEQFGGNETLKRLNVPVPVPQAGEVLIRIAASGINPVDWKIRDGHLQKALPHRFPIILGWEAAGVIEAVGGGVTRFRRGDAVYAYTRLPEVHHGTYAEFIAVPEGFVAAKPESLLFYEAAAVPLAGLTAYQALFSRANVRAGTTVLVHAASGGVGHLGVQLAKSVGATVIGTAGKDNQALLRELGVDHPIDYRAGDFRDAVRRIRPDGVDVVLDAMGGDVQTQSFDVIARGGHMVSIVQTPDEAEAKRRGVEAVYHFVEPSGEGLAKLGALANEGKLRPLVSAFYPLDQAAEALQKSHEGRTRGKAVLLL